MSYCGNCGNELSDLAVACPKCGTPTARGLSQPSAPVMRADYPSAPALRPLAVGEIIDAAIKIYRANAATLFTLAAIVIVPVQVLAGFILASVSTTVTTRIGTTTPGQPLNFDASRFWPLFAAAFIVGAIGLVASQLATAASLRVISEAYLGERPQWQESLDFAFRHLGPLIGVALLVGLLSGLAGLACVIPGIYLAVGWSVSVPVMLFEGSGVWDSMTRSRGLVRGRWWSVFGVLVLSELVALVLQFILGHVFGLLLSVGSSGIATFIRTVIVGSISGVVITPFLAATIAIMYFDLRVRKEGFDLELLAQRVGRADLVPGPSSAPSPGPRRAAPRRPGFDRDTPDEPSPPTPPVPRKRTAPRRPGAEPAPPPDAAPDNADIDADIVAAEPPPKPAPRRAAPRRPSPTPPSPPDEVPDDADTDAHTHADTGTDEPPPKPAPRKAAPRRPQPPPPPPPPPPDDFPDDPEFGHS